MFDQRLLLIFIMISKQPKSTNEWSTINQSQNNKNLQRWDSSKPREEPTGATICLVTVRGATWCWVCWCVQLFFSCVGFGNASDEFRKTMFSNSLPTAENLWRHWTQTLITTTIVHSMIHHHLTHHYFPLQKTSTHRIILITQRQLQFTSHRRQQRFYPQRRQHQLQ